MKIFNHLLSSTFLFLCFIAVGHQNVFSQNIFPEDAWGVHSWTQFTDIDQHSAPLVKGGPRITRWANLESQNGVYAFETEIDAYIQKALDNDWYLFIKIYLAGPAQTGFTPEWLYTEAGIPEVQCERGKFPYYFHNYVPGQPPSEGSYQWYFFRLINALADHILNLPDNLRERVLFIQCTEGSTGDGYCYKGNTLWAYKQYDISRDDWNVFRLDAWKEYKDAYSEDEVLQIPLLTNDDANDAELRQWMLDELDLAIGVKNGMFSHGYQISDAQERLADHFTLKEEAEEAGKVFFARGEMDAEMFENGWITQNLGQGMYWSGIYATHCALTMWNIRQDGVVLSEVNPPMNFFNKYAGELNPETANGAFCAMYRGLDAADVTTFSESTYGSASKDNTTRYINICDAFSQYGATMADPEAATGGGMKNRAATGYNDAGWQILKGNLQRHISQIDPEETSVAWWQIDESVYGRFARGFEHASNKDTLYFNLDDDFFSSAAGTVTMSVIYYDKNAGSTWELQYDAGEGNFKTAFVVTCTGTKDWLKRTIVLSDAEMLNNGPQGSDFALVNTDTLDDIFHLIELERGGTLQTLPEQSSNPNPPNEAADVALNMVLSWTVGTGATEQELYLGTDSLLGPIDFKGIQLGNTFDPDSLQLSTTYYWRVDGYNDGGTTNGPVWKFTTESSPLPAPDNLAGTPISKNQIDLSWSDNSDNETGFSIERSPDGVANWMEIASVAENDTAYSDSLLNPSTTYFYRVRAAKLYGYSDNSAIASATTMDDPVPPIAPDSLFAVGVLDNQINLAWLDQSLHEDAFYIERSDDGVTGWTRIDSVGENVVKYSDTGLEVHTTYHYRVQAANQYGVSAYSNVDSATTLIQGGIITYLSDLPFNTIVNSWGPVELDRSNGKAEAGDGNIITINGVTYDKGIGCHAYSELVWYLGGKAVSFISDIGLDDEKTGAGSVVFEVYLDDVIAFQSDVLTWEDDAVTVGLDVTGVDSLKLIVTDGGDGGNSDHADWAGARVISTEVLVGISEESDLTQPREFFLSQNFPNPFNPTTNINFSIPSQGQYSLRVFNILGKEVTTLVNGEINAGSYKATFDASNLSSGIYFYSLTGNNVNITKIMLLLK